MKKLFIVLTVLFAVIYLQAKEQMKPKPTQKIKSKTENTLNKANDWGSDLILGLIELFLPTWGKYSEGGTTNRDIPLLTSDRKNQDICLWLVFSPTFFT
jgi:hypothetical protein